MSPMLSRYRAFVGYFLPAVIVPVGWAGQVTADFVDVGGDFRVSLRLSLIFFVSSSPWR
jgi:hypothetical protein